MISQKIPVTVCVLVLNEEKNLPSCLEALGQEFEEIVVVDSGSTDATCEIAEQSGATLLTFHWDGGFPKKRNWILRTHAFKTSWVLFMDADERMTPEFVQELREILPGTSHVGYWISLNNWFMGFQLKHGDPFRKLALFQYQAGEYEGIPELRRGSLDYEVHDHPVLEGSLGEIKSRLEHHDYRGIEHYISKHNHYSSWEADRWLWIQSAEESLLKNLTARQRFKYRYLDRWWLGFFYFLVCYIVKGGFLDGRAGLIFAVMKLRYFHDIRWKIQEALRYQNR